MYFINLDFLIGLKITMNYELISFKNNSSFCIISFILFSMNPLKSQCEIPPTTVLMIFKFIVLNIHFIFFQKKSITLFVLSRWSYFWCTKSYLFWIQIRREWCDLVNNNLYVPYLILHLFTSMESSVVSDYYESYVFYFQILWYVFKSVLKT